MDPFQGSLGGLLAALGRHLDALRRFWNLSWTLLDSSWVTLDVPGCLWDRFWLVLEGFRLRSGGFLGRFCHAHCVQLLDLHNVVVAIETSRTLPACASLPVLLES